MIGGRAANAGSYDGDDRQAKRRLSGGVFLFLFFLFAGRMSRRAVLLAACLVVLLATAAAKEEAAARGRRLLAASSLARHGGRGGTIQQPTATFSQPQCRTVVTYTAGYFLTEGYEDYPFFMGFIDVADPAAALHGGHGGLDLGPGGATIAWQFPNNETLLSVTPESSVFIESTGDPLLLPPGASTNTTSNATRSLVRVRSEVDHFKFIAHREEEDSAICGISTFLGCEWERFRVKVPCSGPLPPTASTARSPSRESCLERDSLEAVRLWCRLRIALN